MKLTVVQYSLSILKLVVYVEKSANINITYYVHNDSCMFNVTFVTTVTMIMVVTILVTLVAIVTNV